MLGLVTRVTLSAALLLCYDPRTLPGVHKGRGWAWGWGSHAEGGRCGVKRAPTNPMNENTQTQERKAKYWKQYILQELGQTKAFGEP